MFRGAKEFEEEVVDKVKEAYDFLEAFLEGKEWLAGEEMTIADLSNVATVSSMEVFVPIEEEGHEKLLAWLAKCKELPYYKECNQEGLDLLKEAVNAQLNGWAVCVLEKLGVRYDVYSSRRWNIMYLYQIRCLTLTHKFMFDKRYLKRSYVRS